MTFANEMAEVLDDGDNLREGSRRHFSINGENFASLRGTPNGAT